MASSFSSQEHASSEVVRSVRDMPPSHFILKIDSFSSLMKMLSESEVNIYESKTFEANDYKWKFSVYPNGDDGGNGHISVSLCIKDTNALPIGSEIYTDLKFFMFDQKRDKYTVFQEGGVSRFHRLKPKCGISKLVPRGVFDDARSGYLVDDKCVFGVEIFVLKSEVVGEHLSPSVKVDKTFTWKVLQYSNLGSEERYYSDEFTAGSFLWKLTKFPLGDSRSNGLYLAMFLNLVDPQSTCAGVFVHFSLCIRNQKLRKHWEKQSCYCFGPRALGRGWSKFIPLVDLRDSSKGFLVDDCIIIEAHIKSVSTHQQLN